MSYLAHHGVRGMKWGVRKNKGDKDPRIKSLKEFSKITDNSRRIRDTSRSMRRQKVAAKVKTTNLSTKELERRVKRMRLEQDYRDLKTSQVINGERSVMDVLSIAGNVAAIGASATSIILSIQQIRKGG